MLFITVFNTGPKGDIEISYYYDEIADSDESSITKNFKIEDTRGKPIASLTPDFSS